VGLLLGYLLRRSGATHTEILVEGFVAAGRSVVWFSSFALLEGVFWPVRARVLALATGVAALLLTLCVSGGIGFPSVSEPLFVAMALALGPGATPQETWQTRRRLGPVLPLAGLLAVALTYLIGFLYPVMAADSLVREALFMGRYYRNPSDTLARADVWLFRQVIKPLDDASKIDHGDARIRVQLAQWYGELWSIKHPENILIAGLREAQHAQRLDPDGKDGYLAEYTLLTAAARVEPPRALPDYAAVRYQVAADVMRRVVALDPTEPVLRYMLADTLNSLEAQLKELPGKIDKRIADLEKGLANLPPAQREARQKAIERFRKMREEAEQKLPRVREEKQAAAAQAWHYQQLVGPERRLNGPQLEQVRQWLEAAPAGQ
jgi:hypothetical protein